MFSGSYLIFFLLVWIIMLAWDHSLALFAANCTGLVECFHANSISQFQSCCVNWYNEPTGVVEAPEIGNISVPEVSDLGRLVRYKRLALSTLSGWQAKIHKSLPRNISFSYALWLLASLIFLWLLVTTRNAHNSHTQALLSVKAAVEETRLLSVEFLRLANIAISEFKELEVPSDTFSGSTVAFPVLSPQQHHDLQMAVATFKAISLQVRGQRDSKTRFPAAIVPPSALQNLSGSSLNVAKQSLPESLGPPNVWLKALKADAKEVSSKTEKGTGFLIKPQATLVPKVTLIPQWLQKGFQRVLCLPESKPSFDISTAKGRQELRVFIEDKKKTQSKSEESEAVRPTYAEVCKHDPLTKKKYRRVFVPTRGWLSMQKFEEEEKKLGSNTMVMGRPEDKVKQISV